MTDTVTVSTKYQVVIPLKVRESIGIKPGQKVQMIAYGDRIEMIPVMSMEDARGFLKGIDPTIEREPDRL